MGATKTVTVADILDAMEKNGYKVNRDGQFFSSGIDEAACAIGQAEMNIFGVADFGYATKLYDLLNNLYWSPNSKNPIRYYSSFDAHDKQLGVAIAMLNDTTRTKPSTIAKKVRKLLSPEFLNMSTVIDIDTDTEK